MKNLIYILTLFTLLACEEEKHPLETNDHKALSLLLDLNIANIARNKYPVSMRDSITLAYKLQICEMHDLNEQELDTMLWKLQSDFDRHNLLYAKLVDTLKKLENEFGQGNNKPLVPYDKMIDSLEANKEVK